MWFIRKFAFHVADGKPRERPHHRPLRPTRRLTLDEVGKPVAAGILIYVNELAPSSADVGRIQHEVNNNLTDVRPLEGSPDDYQLQAWTPGAQAQLSDEFRLRRALRVISVTPDSKAAATTAFDNLVSEIESNVLREATLGHIGQAWAPTCRDSKTCVACDFLAFCPRPADGADPDAPPE